MEKENTFTNKYMDLLKVCWKAPCADMHTATQYKNRQILAVLHFIPLASFATYFILGLLIFGASDKLSLAFLVSFNLALLAIATSNLMLWRRYVYLKKSIQKTSIVYFVLTLNLALAALLYAILVLKLFGTSTDPQRALLVAVVAAFTATGCWMYARMPLAGFLWNILLLGTVGIGLLVSFAQEYLLLAWLSLFYCFFLCLTVLGSSSRFIRSLMFENQVAQQAEVIGLLLHEFEENANDWLWETDKDGRLSHVSVHLMKATKQTAKQLQAQTLLDVIDSLQVKDDKATPDLLRNIFQHEKAFKGVTLSVMVKGKTLWWSFKAKPLLDDKQQLIGWRGVTSDITESYNSQLELMKLASIDSLTGIANRYSFIQRLSKLLSREPSFYLLVIDVDNFKAINDSLGHQAGDKLLTHIAYNLNKELPEDSFVARLGGDEFAIICHEIITTKDIELVAHKIQKISSTPLIIDHHQISVKVSIGISLAPQDGKSALELLKACDIALYAAKAAGRNNYSFFTPQLLTEAVNKQTLLNDLTVAIREQQFFLMYQPQYDLHTLQLIGFEALVRWQHPTKGMIPPDQFIPLAESSGLIIELGEWVLHQACKEASTWPEPIRVAVNISGVQCERINLGETVNKVLKQTGLPHQRLELELTESSIMSESKQLQPILEEFRQAGGTVAIDDFGTGFSSFSYLHTFSIDIIKIDRSFIQLLDIINNNKANAIVHSIVQLGRSLGLNVIAEGIETDAQQEFLQQLNCHYGQGYLYSKPITAEAAKAYIIQQEARENLRQKNAAS